MTYPLRFDVIRSCWCMCVVGLVLLAVSGCDHHEENEDHHLEQIIPAHKPADFADAIAQLSARGPAVLAGQTTVEAHNALLDIIDWLPELAADSDLKRNQWELVRDSGVELRKMATNDSNDSLAQWNKLVGELAALVPSSDSWRQQTHTDDTSTSSPTDEQSSASELDVEVHHD